MATPDGPYEGEVPLSKVEDSIVSTIQRDKKSGKRVMYVFDGFPGHKTAADFARFVHDKLRCPADFVVSCQINQDGTGTLAQRFKKKLEVEADLSEEQQDQYKNMMNEYQANVEPFISQFCESTIESGRTRLVLLDTTASSEEYVSNTLKDYLAPKVILLNHEKRVPVDVVAANISIKFNFMYISVYQCIKQHIEANSEWGKRLLLTKKAKPLSMGQFEGKDEFNEEEYSAVHYDLDLVIGLIKETIGKQRRPYQNMIMIEGFCNSARLTGQDDKLELRFMDELFMIEKNIGEVQAVVGLQFEKEKEYIEDNEVEYEVFAEPEVVEVKKKPAGEEGEEGEPPAEEPPAEEGEKKAPKFKVEDWKWTVSDRRPKNLPQLFMQSKGIGARHEVRTATASAGPAGELGSSPGGGASSNINSTTMHEAVSRSLEDFCQKLIDLRNGTEKYLYQQVIFQLDG